MAKIHQAYNSLLKHSEKREGLEKSARGKLQAVIIQLSDANKVRIFNDTFFTVMTLEAFHSSGGYGEARGCHVTTYVRRS